MLVGHEPVRGCVFRPLADPVPVRELNLIRNADRHLTKAVAAFMDLAATAFNQGTAAS
jgi:DNA-binding transcriptional LysR family regulator